MQLPPFCKANHSRVSRREPPSARRNRGHRLRLGRMDVGKHRKTNGREKCQCGPGGSSCAHVCRQIPSVAPMPPEHGRSLRKSAPGCRDSDIQKGGWATFPGMTTRPRHRPSLRQVIDADAVALVSAGDRFGRLRTSCRLRTLAPGRASLSPSRANWSARSFRAWPAWPLHPVPAHAMLRQRRVEPLPQVDVLDRLLVGGAPAVALPLR